MMDKEHRMTFVSDRLIDQIIEGIKTATVERIDEQGYLNEWDTGLGIGYVYTVHDSKRVPKCKIRILRLELCQWRDIPDWLWKGETNDNADEFREDHLGYFDNPSDSFEFVGIEFELTDVMNKTEPVT